LAAPDKTVPVPLLSGGAVVAMNLIGLIPQSARYNPVTLSAGTLELLTKAKAPSDFLPALAICLALTVALIVASVLVFNRKQL